MNNIKTFINKLNKEEKEQLLKILFVDIINKNNIKEIINNIIKIELQGLIKNKEIAYKTQTKSHYNIKYIIDSMLKKANNTKEVSIKRYNHIKKLLKSVGLKLNNHYSKFYAPEIIQGMCDSIKEWDIKGSVKCTYAREIKNIIMHAHALDPDMHKTNLINLIPEFKKTSKEEANPHWPYSNAELKQIFNPKYKYFSKHPDIFWTTLIGLFFGSRSNAATTLQYGDIINIDGIDCIHFQGTHPIKRLKTEASHRIVPIPKQLLDLGFIKYIEKRKQKLKAKDNDFIFPKCQTKSGEYNGKFTNRGFIQYIKDLGITKNNPHKLDFHSLRKNANLRLEEVGVSETFINDIIGWEGRNTRQQSYSNHDLQKIKVQADKLYYDFLQPEFDKWKKIMSNK